MRFKSEGARSKKIPVDRSRVRVSSTFHPVFQPFSTVCMDGSSNRVINRPIRQNDKSLHYFVLLCHKKIGTNNN